MAESRRDKVTRLFRRAKCAVALLSMVASSLIGTAVIVSSPSAYASTPSTQLNTASKTLAQLRLASVRPIVNHVITLSLAGSQVATGRHLASLTVIFGDGSQESLPRIQSQISHIYASSGAFHVRLSLTDSAGVVSVAKRVIIIGAPNHIVLAPKASRLAADQVLSFTPLSSSSERFTLKHQAKLPQEGHTLLIGTSKLLPEGLIAVVKKVRSESNGTVEVVSEDGSISDAYANLSVVTSSNIGSTVLLTPKKSSGSSKLSPRTAKSSAVPFTCDVSGDLIDATADFTNTHISVVMNASSRTFSFTLDSAPIFTLSVGFNGTASCQLADDSLISLPVPAVPGLIISAGPYIKLTATGKVGVTETWSPTVNITVSRAPSGDQNTLTFKSHANSSGSGSASVTLQAGIEVSVSAARVVGLTVSLGPKITATTSVSSTQSCIVVTSDLEVEAELNLDFFIFSTHKTLFSGEYDASTIFSQCASATAPTPPSGSGTSSPPQSVNNGGGLSSGGAAPPYLGPVTSETSGGPASTWANYADGGGAAGPTISALQTVGVVCRIIGLPVQNGNNWWYLIGSSPWNATYYVSADPFYNNGQMSGPLHGTPYVDLNVPLCPNSAGASPAPPTTSPPTTTGSVSIGWSTAHPTWITMTLSGFTAGSYTYSCDFGSGGDQSFPITVSSDPQTFDNGATCYDGIAGDTVWVTIGSVQSNTITVGSASPPPPPTTWSETVGGVAATWTNYLNAGGTEGASIAKYQTVQISCKISGFKVADGDTWWYRIASSPWNNAYYVSADPFYNDGATSGPLTGTPFFDPNVPNC